MISPKAFLSLAVLLLAGCTTAPPEKLEFTPGLRFRYQVPDGDHFMEIFVKERAPRILAYKVRAIHDLNRDGQPQPGEPYVEYAKTLEKPTGFILARRSGNGATWDPVVYRAAVLTENGEVLHAWTVSSTDE